MLFLTFIFFFLSTFIVFDFSNYRYKSVVFAILGLFLFSIAAFRPSNIDRDYSAYVEYFFENPLIGESFLEPSFIAISVIVHQYLFAKPIFLFIIYAAIAVTAKLVAIKQLSGLWFASVLVYFSYLFILNDMTQIRAGASAGFILLSLKPIHDRNFIKVFIFSALAVLFHYSALVILLLFFFKPHSINVKLYRFLILGSYPLSSISLILISLMVVRLPEGAVLNKIIRYEFDNGAVLNIFNAWQTLRCLICLLFLWKIDLIKEKNKYAILLLKVYILATVSFVLLSSNPTLAGRISDLFSVADIIMLPCLIYIIRPRIVGILLVILISFIYLFLNLYYNKIIYAY